MDSYRRLLQMFGATVLGIDSEVFSKALDKLKKNRGTESDTDLGVDDLRELVETFKRSIAEHAGRDFPQDPREQLDLAMRAVFDSWNTERAVALPPPGADRGGPRHRRQRAGHGLRQPRRRLRLRRRVHPRPGVGQPGRVRRLPAERAGRGRRRGHPQHRLPGRHGEDRPEVARRAAGDHGDAGEALPRHVRHRVHRRARQALDAPDPRRQAHARGGVPDRPAHDRRGPDRRRRGDPPRDRRPARAADVPQLRREGRADPGREGHERLPRRGRRQGRLRLRHRGGVGRARRGRDPGPQGDQPRRPARHGRRQGHPDQPRRQDLARRGGRPRHGPHLRLRRGVARRERQEAAGQGPRRRGHQRGRRDLDRRHHRRGVPRLGARSSTPR